MTTTALRVLIADPHPAVRAALRFALELEGMVVRTIDDVGELGAAEALSRIDCMVLDLERGGDRALEAIAALRRDGCRTPVIFTATHPDRRLRARVERAGAWLIEKPLIGEGLIEHILSLSRPVEAA